MWQPVPCVCGSKSKPSYSQGAGAEEPNWEDQAGVPVLSSPERGLCSSSLSDPGAIVTSPGRNLM